MKATRIPGRVRVIHGPNLDDFFGLVGVSVCSVRLSLIDAFNIPDDAAAFVNGSEAGYDYLLWPGDFLEFIRPWGRKGALDPDELQRLDSILLTVRQVSERLTAVERDVSLLVSQRTIKEWYTTQDIATMFNKAEYTVREWCRLHRINAAKVPSLRGGEQEWRISHAELVRYQNEGLLPIPRKY